MPASRDRRDGLGSDSCISPGVPERGAAARTAPRVGRNRPAQSARTWMGDENAHRAPLPTTTARREASTVELGALDVNGETAYYMGYRPWYLVARAAPQRSGGFPLPLGLVFGFATAALRRAPRLGDARARACFGKIRAFATSCRDGARRSVVPPAAGARSGAHALASASATSASGSRRWSRRRCGRGGRRCRRRRCR